MILVDTHAHLYLGNFDADREKVINDAIARGVEKIVLPNINSKSIEELKKVYEKFPSNLFPLMGLHPTSVKDDFEKELEIVKSELKTTVYYGIGESGIDLYWDKTFFEFQKQAFEFQIQLAIEYQLPIIIHARESFDEIFKIISKYKNRQIRGIFHAFTGTLEQAKKIINEFGFFLGIGGIITFKNSGLDKVVQQISLEHLVLETDAPFLAPVPHRGKRNESGYLVYIVEKIAQIQNCSIDRVAEVTTKNASELFNI